MSMLNETSNELYERLYQESGPKAKVSLERVKKTCDDIILMRGALNYSRVAELATKRFGGPKKQSIQNSKLLKSYIGKRIEEYTESRVNGHQYSLTKVQRNNSGSSYPSDGLDIKTRVYIDRMRDIVKRLEEENKFLSKLLEKETRKNPISLAEAISSGVQSDGSVDLTLSGQPILPPSLKPFLVKFFGLEAQTGSLTRFEVLSRGTKKKLVCTDGGVEMTLITPIQWEELSAWASQKDERAR